jgi:excisionase family DNA binding protein
MRPILVSQALTPPEKFSKGSTRQVVAARLLSVVQAAHYLSLSKWTVYEMINDGTLSCVRRRGRIIIHINGLCGWIDNNKEGGDVKGYSGAHSCHRYRVAHGL